MRGSSISAREVRLPCVFGQWLQQHATKQASRHTDWLQIGWFLPIQLLLVIEELPVVLLVVLALLHLALVQRLEVLLELATAPEFLATDRAPQLLLGTRPARC